MTYGFNLEWRDLDEDLREELIEKYASYHDCSEEEAESDIKAHFPIYF